MKLLFVLSRSCFASTTRTSRASHHRRRLRPFSTSNNAAPNRSAAQEYIDGLIGLPPPGKQGHQHNNSMNPVVRARAAMAQGPLLLSGSSYLFPTLRLERHDSPVSLRDRLEKASPSPPHDDNTTTPQPNNKESNWCCPIILDASALAPDGSPHYQPPPPGSLTEMIAVLSRFGMHVIGITKLPSSSFLAEEAAQAGIPSIWAPRRAGSDPKFDMSHVLQLVQHKQRQFPGQNPQPEKTENDSHKEPETAHTANKDNPLQEENVSQRSIKERFAASSHVTTDEDQTNTASLEPDKVSAEDEQSTTPESNPTIPPVDVSSSSTLYHGSVRSGQQVLSAKGKSLVIVGSVNSGGEVMSDGDIFVFGKLRGRAFAGLGMTTNSGTGANSSSSSPARIVATSFDAELVAVGDTFMTIDNVEELNATTPLKAGQPIMVTRVEKGEAPEIQFSAVDL
ncbi:Probable septum site-determining protein MinC [Seminavis robusta]|uniref:Probable septum site-determining protein MinC n=1 Tax=Seminavis robusta TaxID=568900 RepID=A0A9N8HJV0_9STRA|nr:Probable septum site-determining protein MinC [Seminavis robusta]|eukprot:Sro688_g187370.1 Probable septum site-determining protein MinC (451) ;mRNA; r:22445-23797